MLQRGKRESSEVKSSLPSFPLAFALEVDFAVVWFCLGEVARVNSGDVDDAPDGLGTLEISSADPVSTPGALDAVTKEELDCIPMGLTLVTPRDN